MTSGLHQVVDATRELQQHNDGIKLEMNGQVTEMQQLVDSFNELSHSLNTQKQLQKQFTNDLAHELRTPLATLQSQIEAFLDGIWEPTPERLKQGHGDLMRLVRLVNDLEYLLAAENPQIQLHLTEIDAGELLSSIYERYRTTFEKKNIQFFLEVPKPNLLFLGDLDRMNQILTNVINNALKYTGESGKVTISTYKKDDNIIFKVEDTGQGISKEDLPHIFERFYRGEKSRDRRTGGVGIGLSIVKALVKAQNGQIKIISNVEEGTTVYIIFKSSNNSGSY
ncbi:MAG: HAMP domain-containing histidine kinase [Bacillaceae bacterium]|nr:HAMP domain-containing histidine kinase [Bacillaceae bacterium]